MKRQRIYLDTSVIGGCFDKEFERYSNILIRDAMLSKIQVVLSDVTVDEISRAPVHVIDKLREIILSCEIEQVQMISEMAELAGQYLKHKIVTPKFREDAYHIAIATVSQVDVLVSWNFKHIVNLDKIQKFNAVNLLAGYRGIEIRSPREVHYGI